MKTLNVGIRLSGICAYAALAGVATAQMNNGDIGIYTGQPVKESGISLKGWGSGSAVESSENSFGGPHSIKVTTHGRFQGARLVLAKPLDLKSAIGDPNAYLQFTYQIPDRTSTGGISGGMGDFGGSYGRGGAGKGGPSLGGAGGTGGGGNPGSPGGRGGRGGAGGYGQAGGGAGGAAGAGGAGDAKLAKPKAIANLRVTVVTSDGKRLDTALALENSRAQREGWRSLAVPVAGIAGIKETNGVLSEIKFFGDNTGIVFLGEIRILVDETPIRVDDLEERTIAKMDTIILTGSAEAGPTPLKYEWTILGVPSREPGSGSEVTAAYNVNAEGRTFKHQFRKSGDYKITLSVTDVNGLKKPVSKAATIHVTL